MKTETESKQRRSENNRIVITIPLAICQANKKSCLDRKLSSSYFSSLLRSSSVFPITGGMAGKGFAWLFPVDAWLLSSSLSVTFHSPSLVNLQKKSVIMAYPKQLEETV